MSVMNNTTRPDGYEVLSGPFSLTPNETLWWISLVRVPAGNEVGVYIHSSQDAGRTFWYPEEALTALAILRDMESQLREALLVQGRQTQLGSGDDL